MDALEIWDDAQPAVQNYGCHTTEAISDHENDKPRQVIKRVYRHKKQQDLTESSMDDYENNMKWIHRAGLDNLLGREPTPDDPSDEPGAAEEWLRSSVPEGDEEEEEAQLTADKSTSTKEEEQEEEAEFLSEVVEEEEAEPAVAAYAAFFRKHGY